MFSGWVNPQQQQVIDYLQEENRILRGQLSGRRLRLTDDQRRRLAVKGRRGPRKPDPPLAHQTRARSSHPHDSADRARAGIQTHNPSLICLETDEFTPKRTHLGDAEKSTAD